MIIGIDETGTFDLANDSMSFHVGVHVLDKGQEARLASGLEVWKNKYRSLKKNNEIKSSDLTPEMASDFIETVLQPMDWLRITIVGTEGKLHKKRDIQFHRDHHVRGLNSGILKCREIGNESLAGQYEYLRNWYQKLSYQLLLKSWMLSEMIGHSFNSHVIATILTNTDQSLGTIEIKIDQDFVRSKEHVIFWKDLNRSHFYSYTYRNPTPVIEEWPKDHPFFMAKNKKNGGHVVDHSVMRNAINFYRSHDTPLLQVADLVAGIISKYYNRDEFDDAYRSISRYFIPPIKPIRLLKMATQEQAKPDTTPNPWEQLSGK